MWGIISSIFLVLYGLMSLYIGWRGWTALASKMAGHTRVLLMLCLILLILSFPASEIIGSGLPDKYNLWVTLWGWYAMISVGYIFILLLFIDVFRLLGKRFSLIPASILQNPRTPRVLSITVGLIVTTVLVYGSWNAQNPVITEYELNIDKKAGGIQQLKIAMISDIHYGTIIDAPRLEKLVKITNQLKPDLILFAGDILEGTPTEDEAHRLKEVTKQINAKYGIFAVAGNHDRWLRNQDGVEFFQESGIQVLKEEVRKINESFYLIGRDDPRSYRQGRRTISSYTQEIDQTLPIILLDHQPFDLLDAQKERIDLQLAGHTHKGQIFPANFITGQIYELDWGLLTKNNYHLIVSSGYGTWGPPLRIGNNPEVVHIILNFRP